MSVYKNSKYVSYIPNWVRYGDGNTGITKKIIKAEDTRPPEHAKRREKDHVCQNIGLFNSTQSSYMCQICSLVIYHFLTVCPRDCDLMALGNIF